MQAVILAAGESSRFWPLNNKEHKCQIKLLGNSLIYWEIKSLSQKGVKDIILVIGPNSSLREELEERRRELGVSLSFVVQEKPLGTGNALFQAKDLIKEPFFVFWPYKVDAGRIVEKVLKMQNVDIVLTAVKTKIPWDYGMLRYENNRLVEIVENPEKGKEPSDIKTAGSYFLQPDFFDYYQRLKKHHSEDLIDVLNLYIKDKKTEVAVLESTITLKYPWHVFEAFKLLAENFKSYISPSAYLGKNVVVKDNVFVDDNALIGENTVISGPCYIGKNCKIGANNVLRGPVDLEKDVLTGAFAEIKNCVVQEGVHFHSGYFGDSIIGKDCRFGAGFITANRRIDRGNIKALVKGEKMDTGLTSLGMIVGERTRAGIHSGAMPGVLIGRDCVVGPNTLVFENIEDSRIFFAEFKNVKKEKK